MGDDDDDAAVSSHGSDDVSMGEAGAAQQQPSGTAGAPAAASRGQASGPAGGQGARRHLHAVRRGRKAPTPPPSALDVAGLRREFVGDMEQR